MLCKSFSNNFKVLFDDVRSTPLLSFQSDILVHGGTMITASHNPPDYNGYKVIIVWGQIVPPDDKKISESIKKQILIK